MDFQVLVKLIYLLTPDKNIYDPSILERFINDNENNIKNIEFLEIYPYGKGVYNEIATEKTVSILHGSETIIKENRDIPRNTLKVVFKKFINNSKSL